MTLFDDMMQKAKTADGFLAALDQSGGSTPKALTAYGVPTDVSKKTAFCESSGQQQVCVASYWPGLFCGADVRSYCKTRIFICQSLG